MWVFEVLLIFLNFLLITVIQESLRIPGIRYISRGISGFQYIYAVPALREEYVNINILV